MVADVFASWLQMCLLVSNIQIEVVMAENRLKRSKSPEADPSQLASLAALNDQVIAEALQEGDYSSALSLLAQLEAQLRVRLE